MFELPDQFVRTQIEVHGDRGQAWVDRLPAILEACASEWDLTIDPPFPRLSYHYAALATRADGTPAVVKACAPTGEFTLESAALRVCHGRGAATLIAANQEHEVMLLERCSPGTVLLDVEDDGEATSIAADIMRQLWRPVPPTHPFPSVVEWGEGFDRLRRRFDGGAGPFPAALVEEATRLFGDLCDSAAPPVVLHGDLHHMNILAAGWPSTRRGHRRAGLRNWRLPAQPPAGFAGGRRGRQSHVAPYRPIRRSAEPGPLTGARLGIGVGGALRMVDI